MVSPDAVFLTIRPTAGHSRPPDSTFRRAPRRGHRLTPADDELYQRTRISLLQRESPLAMYIDSYSSRGFVVNGNLRLTLRAPPTVGGAVERERLPTVRKPRAGVTGLPVPSKPGISFIPLWSR